MYNTLAVKEALAMNSAHISGPCVDYPTEEHLLYQRASPLTLRPQVSCDPPPRNQVATDYNPNIYQPI